MIRLATAHTIPGPAFNMSRVIQLSSLIDINVRDFVKALEPTTSVQDGADTFSWTYTVASSTNVEAVYGIHALYDVVRVTRKLLIDVRSGVCTSPGNSGPRPMC